MRAARETDSYKFRVILSRKVMNSFKSRSKQYKGRLLLVTKTVKSTGALVPVVCSLLYCRLLKINEITWTQIGTLVEIYKQ